VPLLPASLTERLWVQFSTLLKEDDRPRIRRGSSVGVSPPPDPQPGRVRPRGRRRGPWQRLRAHRHPGVIGSHDPPPTARLGRARRRCRTAQSRARRLRPDDRPRPRRPLIGWVDYQTLGGHRRARHPPRPGQRRRQPARPPPYEPPCARSRTRSDRYPTNHGCTPTAATTPPRPGTCSTNSAKSTRSPANPSPPHPSR